MTERPSSNRIADAEGNGATDLKVAVVTGACRGMGLAIAAQLARDGFKVYGVDVLARGLADACARL